jgi:hypothetical protein
MHSHSDFYTCYLYALTLESRVFQTTFLWLKEVVVRNGLEGSS